VNGKNGLYGLRNMAYIWNYVPFPWQFMEFNYVLMCFQGLIPKDIFLHINNAFTAIDITKDLNLFDIKQLKMSKETSRTYYRLRKGKYRAIFYIENNDIIIIALDKREDIYRKWH
jgi:mRNA interferase RelE/StbE